MRVRQFTQDDAHIFCREDQIVDEVRLFCELLDSVYKDLGFSDYAIKLALRPEKRFGSEEMWDRAENDLREAVRATGRATEAYGWEELPGEGAFYSPSSSSTCATRSAGRGRSARSSSTMCCPSASTRAMSARTARATAR
jgi:threonyl-tRNA synthetase